VHQHGLRQDLTGAGAPKKAQTVKTRESMYLSIPEVGAEIVALCTKLKCHNLMHGAGDDSIEGVAAAQE